MVTETYTGTKGLDLVYEAAKTAYKIKCNLLERYGEAQKKLVDQHALTYVEKAVTEIPEITSPERVKKYLKEPESPRN